MEDSSSKDALPDDASDSLLTELFPSLGDMPGTNPLAFLLSSLQTSCHDDRGANLYNPFNLSPPRISEIHALATASLISQTQEAIMQEYNISKNEIGFMDANHSSNDHSQVEVDKLTSDNTSNYDSKCDLNQAHFSDFNFGLDSINKNVCDSSESNVIKQCEDDHVNSRFIRTKASTQSNFKNNSDIFEDPVETVSSHDKSTLSHKSKIKNDVELQLAVKNISHSNDTATTAPFRKETESYKLNSSNKMPSDKGKMENPMCNKENGSFLLSLRDDMKDCKTVENLSQSTGTPVKHDLRKDEATLKQEKSENEVKALQDTNNGSIVFVCHICLKAFHSHSQLENHVADHKQYVCPERECGRTFNHRSHLHYHLQTHRGEKPHQCEECGCVFSAQQHLVAHRNTHAGLKPFTCSQCDRAFTTLSQLNNHQRIHTGERPYKCDVEGCNKSFTEGSSLKKHKVTHSGSKPHKCPVCGKGFTQTSSRRAHMKKSHPEHT